MQKKNLAQQQELLLKKQSAEIDLQALQTRQKLLQLELDGIGKRYELSRSDADLQKTIGQSGLDTRAQQLSTYSSLYGLSKDFLINQQASLDKEKAQLDTTTAMQAAEEGLNQKREEAAARIAALRTSKDPNASAEEDRIKQELIRQEKLKNNTTAGLEVQLKARNQITDAVRQAALEQEKINRLVLEINRSYELQRSITETQQTIEQGNLDIRNQELSIYGSLYGLSKEYLINQQYSLDADKSRLDTQKAIDAATSELNKKREEAEVTIAKKLEIVNNKEEKSQEKKDAARKAIEDLNRELTHSGKLTDENIKRILTEAKNKGIILNLTKAANLEQERVNKAVEKINKASEVEASRANLEKTRAESILDLKQAELSTASSLLNLEESYVLNQQYVIDAEKNRLKTTNDVAAAQRDYDQKRLIALEQIKSLEANTKLPDAERKEKIADINT